MRNTRMTPLALVLALLVSPLAASDRAAGQQAPPMPKPGPEHALLKMDEGTWDAVVEIFPGPGVTAMTSKGVEVNTMGCGGLCLISDFKGEAMGMPFHGHGVAAWDPAKKKFVGSWTDSMSTGVALGESTYNPDTKKWTGMMEGADPTGKVMRTRIEGVWKDDKTRVMTMYAPGPDGKEMMTMRITYTRRK